MRHDNDSREDSSLPVLLSQVTPEDLDKRAKELGVMSIETSAKAGHNVKTLFKKIAMALPGGSEAKDNGTTSTSIYSSALLIGRNRRFILSSRSPSGLWLFMLGVVAIVTYT